MNLNAILSVYIVCLFVFSSQVNFATSQCQDRDESLLEEGRNCRKSCETDANCRGALKRCLCDDICGMSCYNPDAPCFELEAIANGRISGDVRTYGRRVTYICNKGYVVVGDGIRTCRSDKKWTGSTPTCQPGCNRPGSGGSSSFADADKSTYLVGEEVAYRCRFGYILSGNPNVECQRGGDWSGPRFVCVKRVCREPEALTNGYRTGDNFEFGNRVNFFCNTGYERRGSSSLACNTRGEWLGTFPSCDAVECPAPTQPEHGSVDDRGVVYEYGNIVTYSCDSGYKIEGNSEGTCNENSTWGDVPTCVVDTDCNFEDPRRRTCGYQNLGVGWNRIFSENVPIGLRGYLLEATLNERNNEAKLLSPRIARESQMCLRFYYKVDRLQFSIEFTVTVVEGSRSRIIWRFNNDLDPKNSWLNTDISFPSASNQLQFEFTAKRLSNTITSVSLDDITLTSNSECVNECDSNPCLNGGTCLNRIDEFKCYCARGYEGDDCSTTIQCRVPNPPSNGRISTTRRYIPFDQQITYTCNERFRMVDQASGRLTVTCQTNRRWTGSVPTCVEIDCVVPRAPSHGSVSTNERRVLLDGRITYRCNYGYRMVGQPTGRLTVTCQSDRRWSSDVPRCDQIRCNVPDAPRFGTVSTTTSYRTLDQTITYRCNNGYEMVDQPTGRLTVTCQEDSSWSSDVPRCIVIDCALPAAPRNGAISTRNRRILLDRSIIYTCNHGYEMIDQPTGRLRATCQRDRTWSAEVPRCSFIECDIPNASAFGSILRTFQGRAGLDDRITYRCNDGYRIAGQNRISLTATCQNNRRWSHDVPVCEEITCPDRGAPNFGNANETKSSWSIGDAVSYSCTGDTMIRGAAILVCESDGRWSRDLPTCRELSCNNRAVPDFATASSNEPTIPTRQSVTYTCSEDSELVGEATSICQQDESWSSELPTCVKITCEGRRVPDFATANSRKSSYFVGESVTYTCRHGYELIGETSSECRLDRSWSNDFPSCEEIICENRDVPEFATASSNNPSWRLGDSVTYTCMDGYELIGEATSECLIDRSWSNQLPVCRENVVTCPEEYREWATFCVKAVSRAKSFDEATADCESDEATLPIIRRRDVQRKIIYLLPRHSAFWVGLTDRGQEGVFRWVTGELFDESGYNNITDLTRNDERRDCIMYYPRVPDRMWDAHDCSHLRAYVCIKFKSQVRPFRLISNDSNSHLFNGVYLPESGTFYNRLARYKLRTSNESQASYVYYLKVRTEGSTWCFWYVGSVVGRHAWISVQSDAETPQQITEQWETGGTSESPGTSASVTIEEYDAWSDWSIWSECSVSCDGGQQTRNRTCDGFHPRSIYCPGSSTDVRQCNALSCEIQCQVPNAPDFVTISHSGSGGGFVALNDRVTYRCNDGYRMIGHDGGELIVICQENRILSQDAPHCEEIRCLVPLPPLDGSISSNEGSLRVDETITYSCAGGYRMVGQPTNQLMVICQSDESWSADVPECVAIECVVPESLEFVLVSHTGSVSSDVEITYACQNGYIIAGQQIYRVTATCQVDGRWSRDAPVCVKEVTCDVQAPPRHGYIVNDRRTVKTGVTVTYRCNVGYLLVVPRSNRITLTCENNGMFSDDVPEECVNECVVPDINSHVRVSRHFQDEARSGDRIRYNCEDGYEFDNQANAQIASCQVDGSWSIDVPQCTEIQCEVPASPQHGSVSTMQRFISQSDVITYTCNHGFEMIIHPSGELTVTCRRDKSWSSDVPECREIRCDVPNVFGHGSISTELASLSVDERLTYSCDDGYMMINQPTGQLTVTCQNNGRFSQDPPRCVGIWSEWGEWSPCSTTCGDGQQTRSRSCSGRTSGEKTCDGSYTETRTCNHERCRIEIRVGNRIYSFFTDLVNYETASQNCGGNSGNIDRGLAIIRSENVQNAIAAKILELPGHRRTFYYIGMMRGEDGLNWYYRDGLRVSLRSSQPQSFYQNWNDGEPNNYAGTEYCGTIVRRNGGWNDENCVVLGFYICEEPYDPCYSSPCQHDGVCNIGGFNRYICACPNMISGDDCETIDNQCYSSPCQNGGECTGNQFSYSCECPEGTGGINCETRKCVDIEEPSNGNLIRLGRVEFYQPNSYARITCDDDYRLVGSRTVVCQSNYRWSDDVPTCEAIGCRIFVPSVPAGITITDVNSFEYQPGETLQVSCTQSSQNLNLNPTLTCRIGNRWEPNYIDYRCA